MSTFPTSPIARLGGHNGQVLAVTFSSGTGQYVLTGSSDRSIRLFNPRLRKSPLIQTYAGHGYEVLDLHISSDNSRFASAGGDKVVYLWDVAAVTTLRRFAGHAGRVNAVRLAGEGESLVISGSYDGSVKVWDTKQRGERAVMSMGEARDSVSAVDVREWEVVVGSVDGRVRGYDFRMGRVETDAIGAPVTSVAMARAGDSYLVSTLDSTIRLMDRRDGKCLQTFRDEQFENKNYRIRSTFAAADALVISGSENGQVLVWDIMTGGIKHRLRHAQGLLSDGRASDKQESSKKDVVSAVAWNQLRKQWATAGGDGTVVVWGNED
ncbi:WD40 repeat-like protein [Myriangium duriaei CBS 260.36]|uniref:WD40 repeat-like protein n=1 Tax=Myriangium duriaei CBS 260.36 TaxID=1168546 RepID=A0A9P4J1K1_9PEZI|nr:WD40 repeat-like protein [Myriangium duriaei CBS 260.36]